MKSCAFLRCGFAEPNETKDTEQEKTEGKYLLYEKLCTLKMWFCRTKRNKRHRARETRR